ncbi:metalloregulator ArsR/SmtB family transcription factor [Arthrobacter sp. AFG20]|uniref:helix-turn-helix transcriptional regulator n=1 Tax=Arthrobacter sp. AFG20 TaxID=1688671 RepID=UPI000C9E71A3|nr:helix-turn-helix domain-containing protein [Arthrobacter sp. AFG20]PNH84559.1 transcriptional regulator [Arthrobacter sp. AFG20]
MSRPAENPESKSGLSWTGRLAALASLGDASRRRLFEYVAGHSSAVGRDDAAAALGMPRSTASFHLDRLVRDGLLAVEFRKLGEKAGPGSGRPAKLYRPAMEEVGVSVPDRSYDLAGELMATAIESSMTGGGGVREALADASYSRGRALGGSGSSLGEVLGSIGYMPEQDAEGGTILTNCPFHRLADGHADVVCAMSGALLSGAAAACGVPEEKVVEDRTVGRCCARIRP